MPKAASARFLGSAHLPPPPQQGARFPRLSSQWNANYAAASLASRLNDTGSEMPSLSFARLASPRAALESATDPLDWHVGRRRLSINRGADY